MPRGPPPGYRCLSARSVSDRLRCDAAEISLTRDQCRVAPKEKRDLPTLLEAMQAICPVGGRDVAPAGAHVRDPRPEHGDRDAFTHVAHAIEKPTGANGDGSLLGNGCRWGNQQAEGEQRQAPDYWDPSVPRVRVSSIDVDSRSARMYNRWSLAGLAPRRQLPRQSGRRRTEVKR